MVSIIDSTNTEADQNSKKTQQPSKKREHCLEGTTRDKGFVVVSEVLGALLDCSVALRFKARQTHQDKMIVVGESCPFCSS